MSHQSELISQDILAYLKQHEQKDLLRFLTCGNVDDGKSTLIGRLLHDSKMIYEDQLEAVQRDSKKVGTQGEKIDLALLVDGLQAEREQGITIDVAYRYFSTEKRKFIIADTPGHEQYTRNMATGASTCDLAIILIDARYGVQTQTRRHTFISALLGIRNIVVAINKMDLVEFSEQKFKEIQADYFDFVKQLGDRTPSDIRFVPISALNGDNVVNPSENTPWYFSSDHQGQTLMQILESVQINHDTKKKDFRLPIQYVNRPNLDFRGFAGTIALGSVNVGDEVVALPSGKKSTIKEIVTYDGNLNHAFVGQAVTVTLNDEIDISRGDMLVHSYALPQVSRAVRATVVWMNEQPLVKGKLYNVKVGVQSVPAKVTDINYRVDVNTLEKVAAEQLELNAIADILVEFDRPIVFDNYKDSRHTGAFIFIDRLSNVTVGAAMIEDTAQISNSTQAVSSEERAARLGQKPAVLAVNADIFKQAQQLERALLDNGIVALAKAGLDAQQVDLLRETGLTIIVDQINFADSSIDATTLDAAVQKIQQLVQL
ncbi:sulfate adenylyltransferase subunit CysN [Acinetobacter qingfengensis]|uniref:Sulfate adenylyltransferase subunit 1 n=1 Tax=Acinetobacter qingfengensis TaxID=1262585 RepID=A0A1E7R1S8_9GAMM|nr:sulfate adenylyltransferase subunit CysN [Acinetobacter qingfengensis]KAA8734941.1 sulfate adenylyltransferase subunit CysN [Acinetobacter qingfengensis]OEY93274.1 sulfate adenylyltransferase subunit CysN [Acinetobacter qingfengensis]